MFSFALQAPPISYLSNRRYFALGSSAATPSGAAASLAPWASASASAAAAASSKRLGSDVAEALDDAAGLWEAQLRYLQRLDDADATESSSGGESDDEHLIHGAAFASEKT